MTLGLSDACRDACRKRNLEHNITHARVVLKYLIETHAEPFAIQEQRDIITNLESELEELNHDNR